MMRTQLIRRLVLPLLVIAALGWGGRTALANPPLPRMNSATYAMDWSAAGGITGGGGSSAHYALNQVTIDQAGANTLSSSASARLCTGWECAGWSYNPSLYLPFVER